MAHQQTGSTSNEPENGSPNGGRRSIVRRSYLGIVGAVAVSVAMIGASKVTAAMKPDESSEEKAGTSDDEPVDGGDALAIRGSGIDANYEFSVSGDLESTDGGLERRENVYDRTATGQVTTPEHVDGYRFEGGVTDFVFLEGEADVLLNGEEVDPAELVSATGQPNVLTITGTDTSADYAFTVESKLEANPERGGLEQWDNVDGNTATGWVASPNHVDSYRFDGQLIDFRFRQGEAIVELNGERIDPVER